MLTTASKFFFAGAAVAFLASYVYGIGTDGDLLGVLTLGLKGPVGELAGYTILQTVGALLLGLGATSSILRDADPDVQAATARLEALPPATAPVSTSYWPVLGALAAVIAAVGLVASPVLFVIGALGVLLVLLEWMVSAWSERATGDPALNRQIRNRLMYPLEIPVAGALGILVLVVSVSRVFLALPKNGSSAIAIVASALILAFGFVVAYRPKLSKDAIAGVLAVCGLLVIAGGIGAAVAGPREFEHHGEEHGDEADHTDEGGAGGAPGQPDETDAGGGGDAGAEERPDADNVGQEEPEDGEETPGTAEGTDENIVGGGTEGGLPSGDEEGEG